jgi:hypothetical protein
MLSGYIISKLWSYSIITLVVIALRKLNFAYVGNRKIIIFLLLLMGTYARLIEYT